MSNTNTEIRPLVTAEMIEPQVDVIEELNLAGLDPLPTEPPTYTPPEASTDLGRARSLVRDPRGWVQGYPALHSRESIIPRGRATGTTVINPSLDYMEFIPSDSWSIRRHVQNIVRGGLDHSIPEGARVQFNLSFVDGEIDFVEFVEYDDSLDTAALIRIAHSLGGIVLNDQQTRTLSYVVQGADGGFVDIQPVRS